MCAKWYLGTGAQNDVVINTSIHLARNLRSFPFPGRLSLPDKLKVNAVIKNAADSIDNYYFNYYEMKTLSQSEVVSLAERHLVSPEFASSRDGRALLLTEDEAVSIMLNEEDHIRLQVMYAGFALDDAYRTACQIERELSGKLEFAFDDKLGYLTQDPTALGTGMKASVVLHLPGLVSTSQITKLITTVSKLGLSLRGSYGEGAAAKGDMFRLSNTITLGISEKAAIENLKSIALQIAAQERTAREELFKAPVTEDRIYRAYGVLRYARLIDTNEFMELISLVRLGAVKGIINMDCAQIEALMIHMQPATISLSVDRPLDRVERDKLRAAMVRKALM
ncbi:MAG: ATP--guanido phosphotransferase [Ruminococcaceae bacterium]|nr:ATP--guanido phosphotransferase [Oscillospiraceae bacterium]